MISLPLWHTVTPESPLGGCVCVAGRPRRAARRRPVTHILPTTARAAWCRRGRARPRPSGQRAKVDRESCELGPTAVRVQRLDGGVLIGTAHEVPPRCAPVRRG